MPERELPITHRDSGLAGRCTRRSQAFCAHALAQTDILEVNDARADPRFADNPLVTHDPFLRFYAGAPLITTDGYVLGTLCVFGTEPKTLTRSQTEGLRTLAVSVAAKLERDTTTA